MLTKEVQDWISKLGLIPHPEGGYFKSTYVAEDSIGQSETVHQHLFLINI